MSSIKFAPKVWAAAGVTAAAVTAGPATAATITANILPADFTSSSVGYTNLLPGESASSAAPTAHTVSKFDPTLGTLVSVELGFIDDGYEGSSTFNATLPGCEAEGGGDCTYDINVSYDVTGTMTTPEGNGTSQFSVSFMDTTTLSAVAPPTPYSVIVSVGTFTAMMQPAGFGTNLALYQGPGTWDLLFDVGIGNVTAGVSCTPVSGDPFCLPPTDVDGTLTGGYDWYVHTLEVTYTYDPFQPPGETPAPASLGLFGIGLGALGLGGLRRRRKAGD